MTLYAAKPKGLLIDITRCIGCNACAEACKQLHGFSQELEPELSATSLTIVTQREDRHVRRLCMHCVEPACTSACPVGALHKLAAGPVVYDADKCIGCRYCMLACAYSVPRYQWSKLAPYVKKCDMCVDRQAAGKIPACAEACPVEATVFGEREELLRQAQQRINENPGKYIPHIFGSEEAGGTSVLFLSDVPFEKLGFPPLIGKQPRSVLATAALTEVPPVVMVGGGLLASLYWITERRRAVALAEGHLKNERSTS
jgi:formate dehydrogenase iron-sulfur subunit